MMVSKPCPFEVAPGFRPQVFPLVTKEGHAFWGGSCVIVKDNYYDMSDLSALQHKFVAGKLNEQGLNAAYAGTAVFTVDDLPSCEEAFGELAHVVASI